MAVGQTLPGLLAGLTVKTSAKNLGPDTADSLTLTTQLPAAASSVSGLPAGCAYNASTDRVTCSTTGLASGATKVFSYSVNFTLPSLGQFHVNTTRTASSPNDPAPGNDSASGTCKVMLGLLITC